MLTKCQKSTTLPNTTFIKKLYPINIPPFKDFTRLNFIVAFDNGKYGYKLFGLRRNLLPKLQGNV